MAKQDYQSDDGVADIETSVEREGGEHCGIVAGEHLLLVLLW